MRENIVLSGKEVLLETRKIPSPPEETKNKKKKIEIDYFFQNAIILPDGTESEGIRSTK